MLQKHLRNFCWSVWIKNQNQDLNVIPIPRISTIIQMLDCYVRKSLNICLKCLIFGCLANCFEQFDSKFIFLIASTFPCCELGQFSKKTGKGEIRPLSPQSIFKVVPQDSPSQAWLAWGGLDGILLNGMRWQSTFPMYLRL